MSSQERLFHFKLLIARLFSKKVYRLQHKSLNTFKAVTVFVIVDNNGKPFSKYDFHRLYGFFIDDSQTIRQQIWYIITCKSFTKFNC